MPIALATVSPLNLPQWVDLVLWSTYPVVVILAILSLTPQFKLLRANRKQRPVMSSLVVVLIGAFVGGCTSLVIWNILPDEADNAEAAPSLPPVEPKVTESPARAAELDLLVRTLGWSHSDAQVFAPIRLTNRSEKDMALSFDLLMASDGKDSKVWWQQFSGRWNGSRGDPNAGDSFVKVPKESAVDGHLVFNLPNPKIVGLEKWNFSGLSKDNLLEISDRITGVRVWCSLARGYPPGVEERPWVPIRTPADDLGVSSEVIPQIPPPLLPLKYMSWGSVRFTANESTPQAQDIVHLEPEFTNRSARNMSLSFILMIKFPVKDGSYFVTSAEGEWKDKLTDSEFREILNLPHESTVKGHLVFRLMSIKMLKQLYADKDFGVDKWADVKGDMMALRIEDKVSGEFVLTDSIYYPCKPEWFAEWKKGL